MRRWEDLMSAYLLFQWVCTAGLIVYAVVQPQAWPIGLAFAAVVFDIVEWNRRNK